MATSSNAFKLELVTPAISEARPFIPMDRKKKLWPEVEKYWLPKLGRSFQSNESAELISIIKGIFFRQLTTDKGIGGAIAFSKFVFPEAYRLFKRGDNTRPNEISEECSYCGGKLKRINARGFACEDSHCEMFGVAVNVEMLRKAPRTFSLDDMDASLESNNSSRTVWVGNDIVLQLSTRPDETKLTYDGVLMDERLVKILESRSTTPQVKSMILDALTGDFTEEALAEAYGTSARTVKRQFRALNGGKSATKNISVNS